MASKRVVEECSIEEMEDDLGVGEEEDVMLPEVATASNGLWGQPCTSAPEIVLPSEREACLSKHWTYFFIVLVTFLLELLPFAFPPKLTNHPTMMFRGRTILKF